VIGAARKNISRRRNCLSRRHEHRETPIVIQVIRFSDRVLQV
jgi:hypothetical protein